VARLNVGQSVKTATLFFLGLLVASACARKTSGDVRSLLLMAKTPQEELNAFVQIQSASTGYSVVMNRKKNGLGEEGARLGEFASVESIDIRWADGAAIHWMVLDAANLKSLMRDR